jgi:hypothetical protein
MIRNMDMFIGIRGHAGINRPFVRRYCHQSRHQSSDAGEKKKKLKTRRKFLLDSCQNAQAEKSRYGTHVAYALVADADTAH